MNPLSPADDRLITTSGRLLEAGSQLDRLLGPALLAETGLQHTWFEVLLRLSRSEGGQLTMSALASEVALTTGGITRMIDRIEAAGYVERRPCPTDRRVAYAAITDPGRAVLAQALVVQARRLREVFAEFSEADLATLDELLDRVRRVSRVDGAAKTAAAAE
ncbi:MarR family transcriptional regulator [Amycolatopsis rhabdoformis]|uniref:MarR family transcriptional regulator n=1 Tax=Amycolatopsis rhabdoformis TaxID=1448059 RepID=A0ABZ1IJ41_9PSEU|nr:MarR family transcriptional regulator [Amycolatopsis rhabdoformis]WSE34198.1 MarR family transcriptional regulator [Amycolatopsis rhabdoformis]